MRAGDWAVRWALQMAENSAALWVGWMGDWLAALKAGQWVDWLERVMADRSVGTRADCSAARSGYPLAVARAEQTAASLVAQKAGS